MTDDRPDVELGVSEFVALLNQTLEYAYPNVTVTGELANLRVSRNRWVYFDLKDEAACVKFFGTVYHLPGPMEDGMMLKVRGQPRLHPLYGFSVNVMTMRPAGEGTIRRAAALLKAKLAKEGLFDEARKRPLPYPPGRVGLIASRQSAAYADFVKVLGARWHGVSVELIDVQVQGEAAPGQIAAALEQFNAEAEPSDVVVLIRGGGSAEDLAAFNTEQVARAVAASRAPTLAAIGHETDLSLAELAADRRASTPSNAAELLVPDRRHVMRELRADAGRLARLTELNLQAARDDLAGHGARLAGGLDRVLDRARSELEARRGLLRALDPEAILRRGYSITRHGGKTLRTIKRLPTGAIVEIQLADGRFRAGVTEVDTK
ncbi:MAG TPA: exodeoxyribonuclease VII large subunit [Candidatus Saccharimonadales bacterium]|nr:exodeoxyribonuclease VII large subunit [Candidatus Saccharimonadales bacterium]